MEKKVIILLLVILAGCRVCPPSISTNDTIIERQTIIYRDTVVEYNIIHDTVYDSIYIPIERNIYAKLYKEVPLAWAEAQVKNSKLSLLLVQKDTTIEMRLNSAIREVNFWKYKYHNDQKIIEKKEFRTPFWNYILIACLLILCIILFFKSL